MGMDYTEAQRASDKLQRETRHFEQMAQHETVEENVELLLAQAKRVRTASNLAVRAFARLRDQLQP